MTEHEMRIFAGSANRPLAEAVAHHLGQELGDVTITHLPDSEIHVQIEELVRHKDIFIIQPCSAPVNDHLMELLLLIDAFRRASVHSVTAVIPYFPYARQERMARGREAISAKVVVRMLEEMGVDRVIFVDIHSLAIQGFFNIPVDPLTAMPVLADYFKGDPRFANAAVVAPDVGRARLAGKYAEYLGLPLVVMHKRRTGFAETKATHVVGEIAGKVPIVIDDIIASGSVLDQLPALIEAGAEPPVYLSITHPVLLPTALARLNREVIGELVVTDTIHVPPERRHPKLHIVSVAPLLAEAIHRIYAGRSVSPLLRLV
ncbi:MAG: ribose-phosphate diphosphokinase [Chloroflexi bacterium]|nr:MAG: ribose-phosphate diphosphokinase [Chloroflexota bacterium]